MSLIGALNVGASGLAAAQASIQVTGNNIANAGNADYTREISSLSTASDQQLTPGIFIGNGVDLTAVKRQVDDALQVRLNSSISDNQSAVTTQQWLSRVQSTFNALSGNDLSSQMSSFFNGWSNLANKPADVGLRQVVLQNGDSLAKTFQSTHTQLNGLLSDVGQTLQTQTQAADALASQIATLNGQIVVAEGGGGGESNALRDQRDAVIKKLSGLMNVQTVQQPNGVVNVYVGSNPLVFGTQSNGVAIKQQSANGQITTSVAFKSNNATMNVTSGELGSLASVSTQINAVIGQVNMLAHNLVFELNKIHANGQGLAGFTSTTSTNPVTDPTAALKSPGANLPFTPVNGSFVVHVRQKSTGLVTSTLVPVQLTGAPTDSTLNSLATSLSTINGLSATVSNGKLTISATSSTSDFTFSQDTSGTLAALGINTFFTGTGASDIAVNATVSNQPQLIAAARNGNATDNQTAVTIAALGGQSLAALGGNSLDESYQRIVNTIGNQTAAATTQAQASQAVQQTLQSQHESTSGVSLDEEMVNLMKQQTAYQGAARLITTVNTMMQELMALVR